MLEKIKIELKRLEQQNDFKILLAVESGSRAWGFASTDSDWDVRYLYINKLDWYLKIDGEKDSQEEMLPDDLDFAGWELKKALKLFRKSNPPMLEWLRSSIVYLEQFSTAAKLREMSENYFNPKSCMYHYLSMARNNFREFLQKQTVKSKKYFYVLRPVLACDWIKEKNSFPPMEFQGLVDSQVKDERMKFEITALLERKMAGEELKEEPKIEILNEFLESKIEFYKNFVEQIEPNDKPQTEMLDALFKETIYEVWK